MKGSNKVEAEFVVENELGLHARPAGRFAALAARFESEISVGRAGEWVDARSVLSLLSLAAGPGTCLRLRAVGSDAEQAVKAEQIIGNCPDPPAERSLEGRAWYSSELDTIGIPPMERFESAEKFYCTRFHEYGHATGHPRRLHRFDIADCSDIFGSESYSKEELVAELTAAFLCAHAGIDNTLEHSASYLQGWLKRLREDRKLIVIAAASAQKAADYILGRTFSDSISVAGCDPA